MDLKEISVSIPPDLGKQVIKMSKESDLSIYIFLLSILKILIFRYMFNEDSIVISPINKLKATVETLNDLLFIRNRVNETMTFKDLVLEVRRSVLDAYENQDYPFYKILESLFPGMLPLEAHGQGLSRVLCSLRELHGDEYRNVENINTTLSFCFFKEGVVPPTDEGGHLAAIFTVEFSV
jgi:non-ribosomal peptide synthetase component F